MDFLRFACHNNRRDAARHRRVAVLLIAVVLLFAGRLRADTIVFKIGTGTLPAEVTIVSIDSKELVSVSSVSALLRHHPIESVVQIKAPEEPTLTAAEQAYADGKWSDAVTKYLAALNSSSPDWVKNRSIFRIFDAAAKCQQVAPAVAAFIELAKRDPAIARMYRPEIKALKPDQIEAMIGQVEREANGLLKSESAAPSCAAYFSSRAAVLREFLVDLQRAKEHATVPARDQAGRSPADSIAHGATSRPAENRASLQGDQAPVGRASTQRSVFGAQADGRSIFEDKAPPEPAKNTPPPTRAVASPQQDEGYLIVNKHSGQLLTVVQAVAGSDRPAVQWPRTGEDGQLWRIRLLPDGSSQITHPGSGLALRVASHNPGEGATLDHFSSRPEQEWNIEPLDGGVVRVKNRGSGLCLGIADASTRPGVGAIQWTWTNDETEKWTLEPARNRAAGEHEPLTAVPIIHAQTRYREAIAKAAADYRQAAGTARAQYESELTAAQDTATKANEPGEAARIHAAADELKNEQNLPRQQNLWASLGSGSCPSW